MQKILAILLTVMLVVACSSSDNVDNNNNVQDTDQTTQHNANDHDTQNNDESASQDATDNSDTTNNSAAVNSETSVDASASGNTSSNLVADTTWQSNVENTANSTANLLDNAANSTSETVNNTVNSTNDTTANTSTSASVSASANASGQVILILNFNELVEKKERDIITKATKNKWFKDKQPIEITEKTYYDQSAQYMGATVFIAKVLRAYGEFTMNVRTGTLTKDSQGYFEEPISNWSVRGAQTAEDLAKEIKYGDDVFAKK